MVAGQLFFRRVFECNERFDELPIDGATGFRALRQLGQEVARILWVNRIFEVGLQQLADAAVPLLIGPEVVEADDVPNLGEVEDPFDATFALRAQESGMAGVDARVEDGPGDLAAVDLEERPRRIRLDRGNRAKQRVARPPVERDRVDERGLGLALLEIVDIARLEDQPKSIGQRDGVHPRQDPTDTLPR